MKRILFIISAITIGFGAMAQKNGHANGKHKQGKNYHKKQQGGYDDDRYERNQGTINDRIFRTDSRNDNYGNNNGKYTNNAPRKVRDAFYSDYPNASKVSWTKDRGVWTARFNRGGIFGGGNTVSYRANGQRVGSNNAVYGSTRNRDRNTQPTNGGTVWDKVMRRPQ